MFLTASQLYDFTQCPHRVWRDLYGPQDEKTTDPNPFVELLWQRGLAHEESVVAQLGTFENLAGLSWEEGARLTLAAMRDQAPLIYQGVLLHEDMMGRPDLLQRRPDGTYVAVDIKSGMGLEGENSDEADPKPKKHYAVQLAFYADLIQRLGFGSEHTGYIIDKNLARVHYRLDEPMGPKTPTTYWQYYQWVLAEVRNLVTNTTHNDPAYSSGACKLCPWYASCLTWCKDHSDPSLLFMLGRKIRDILRDDLHITHLDEMCDLDIAAALAAKKQDKQMLKGIAQPTLESAVKRARILTRDQKPVFYKPIVFPDTAVEVFYDIESDPTQDLVYLHGVYERRGKQERYLSFVAADNTPAAEEHAWREFWEYVHSLGPDFTLYYYAPYERTMNRRLQSKYPGVVSSEDIEALFAVEIAVDLYTHVILKKTDWPLSSYSIKAIAQYLGFTWRDESPSGALSIQWYNEYLTQHEDHLLQRILDYNEDDCKATMVLKDYLAGIRT
jgi:uncharacterized protein